jgi:hypothetical protein
MIIFGIKTDKKYSSSYLVAVVRGRHAAELKESAPLFSSFPSVCPEPVLVT